MRIVAGQLKGRRLDGPTWDGLRPTSDSLRETLFNVIGPSIAGVRFLDVFAGTGAVGIEAFSRGAASVTFVESDARAIKLLQKNLEHVGLAGIATLVREDFMSRVLKRSGLRGPFDLVFLDPPYEIPAMETALERAVSLTAPAGRIILEHSRRRLMPETLEGASRYRVLEAGDSALSFYTVAERP